MCMAVQKVTHPLTLHFHNDIHRKIKANVTMCRENGNKHLSAWHGSFNSGWLLGGLNYV